MTKKQTIQNWTYVITGIILLGFLGPFLISAPFTPAVLLGVILIVLYFVRIYYIWLKPLAKRLKEIS